jgi:hypothetical protein
MVALGSLCLVAQLSDAAHMLLVEHVRCAEHGELTHAPESHARLQGETHRAGGPIVTPGAALADDEHDHCLICSDRRKLALVLPAVPVVHAPGAGQAVARPGYVAWIPAQRTYSFAPKTSPPV